MVLSSSSHRFFVLVCLFASGVFGVVGLCFVFVLGLYAKAESPVYEGWCVERKRLRECSGIG